MDSQVPSFLRSLAALIRQLVASGRAQFVTKATAQELELLAGVFEQNDTVRYWTSDEVRHDLAAADFALGWLRASRIPIAIVHPALVHAKLFSGDILRVSVCAELAVLAAGSWASIENLEGWPGCNPYDGTRDGAIAAWRFIVDEFNKSSHGLYHPLGKVGDAPVSLEIMHNYRRELEGMQCR